MEGVKTRMAAVGRIMNIVGCVLLVPLGVIGMLYGIADLGSGLGYAERPARIVWPVTEAVFVFVGGVGMVMFAGNMLVETFPALGGRVGHGIAAFFYFFLALLALLTVVGVLVSLLGYVPEK